jgi:hypothetical protein
MLYYKDGGKYLSDKVVTKKYQLEAAYATMKGSEKTVGSNFKSDSQRKPEGGENGKN